MPPPAMPGQSATLANRSSTRAPTSLAKRCGARATRSCSSGWRSRRVCATAAQCPSTSSALERTSARRALFLRHVYPPSRNVRGQQPLVILLLQSRATEMQNFFCNCTLTQLWHAAPDDQVQASSHTPLRWLCERRSRHGRRSLTSAAASWAHGTTWMPASWATASSSMLRPVTWWRPRPRRLLPWASGEHALAPLRVTS